MVFDAARSEAVLFGGQDAPNPPVAETWIWNGQNWAQRMPVTSPSGRSHFDMCFDSVRGRVVLYGGMGAGGAVFGDTWEWNGTTWSQATPPASPPARAFPQIAFDGTRTLMFGGGSSALPRADLWSYNGTTWQQVTTANAPSPRYYHSMVSNGQGELLLFGGFDPTVGYGNSTWRFNGTNWSQVSSASSPSARGSAQMTWDGSRYLLFSGSDSFFSSLEDTWAFANGQWTQLTTARSPSSRSRAAVAWFAPSQRFVVYGGGYQQPADLRSTPTWEFGSGLASFVRWGPSACPAIDPPLLGAANSQPALGATFRAHLTSVSAVHCFMIMGFSTTTWSGGALPFDLVAFGTWPSCLLRVSPDATVYSGFGQDQPWTLAIPTSAAYLGTQFHVQGFTFGLGNFPTNLSTANAATGVIGAL